MTTTAGRLVPASPLTGFAIVILAASLFGMLGPLSRFAYEAGMEPIAFVAWRAGGGAAAALLVVAWRIRRGSTRIAPFRSLGARAGTALAVAALAGFAVNLAMFVAFDRVTVALALLGFYTYPAMVALVAVASGRERLDGPRSAALLLALAGMIAVVASQLEPGSAIRLDALGIGLALGAAVSQTVFVMIGRDGFRAVPTDQAMSVVLVTTVVCCLVLALAAGSGAALAFPLEHPDVLPLVLFAGVFAAAVPSLAFLAGIRMIGGMRAGILMLWEPVVGVALAAWLLNEGLAPIQVAGGVAILGAALLLQRLDGPTAVAAPVRKTRAEPEGA